MSNNGYGTEGTPEQLELQREVKALSRPRAASDFRTDLKQAFRVGEIDSAFSSDETFDEASDPAAAPTGAEDLPNDVVTVDFSRPDTGTVATGPEPIQIPTPRSHRVLPWFTAVAVAAAAVLLAVLLKPDTASEWKVVTADQGGTLIVEGTSYDLATQLADLPTLLPGEQVVYEGNGTVELLAPGFCAIELISGTALQLPLPAEEALHCEIDRGTARFVTGPDFAGNLLSVTAADTEVQVTGTTFSVLTSADKTCVSVFEGEVSVRAADGSVVPVSAGNCRTVYLDTRPALDHGLNATQAASLAALFERGSTYFDQ